MQTCVATQDPILQPRIREGAATPALPHVKPDCKHTLLTSSKQDLNTHPTGSNSHPHGTSTMKAAPCFLLLLGLLFLLMELPPSRGEIGKGGHHPHEATIANPQSIFIFLRVSSKREREIQREKRRERYGGRDRERGRHKNDRERGEGRERHRAIERGGERRGDREGERKIQRKREGGREEERERERDIE
ncbi:Splicing factor U2af large subunit B, partial [Ophiophagus hannah]